MDNTEYSADPYEDGTVPADADFATSGADGAAKESEVVDAPDEPDEIVGATGDGEPNPGALVEGNRVATAKDME